MSTNEALNYLYREAQKAKIREELATTTAGKKEARAKRRYCLNRYKAICRATGIRKNGIEITAFIY